MGKGFVPIIQLKYDVDWPNDILNEVLESYEVPDEFTYTMRLSVPEEKRQEIREQLESRDDADGLLELLDEHDWDVSFFVDCW